MNIVQVLTEHTWLAVSCDNTLPLQQGIFLSLHLWVYVSATLGVRNSMLLISYQKRKKHRRQKKGQFVNITSAMTLFLLFFKHSRQMGNLSSSIHIFVVGLLLVFRMIYLIDNQNLMTPKHKLI